MESSHSRLADQLDREVDDVLAALQLVAGEPALLDHLFEDLVDLLVEALFVDARARLHNDQLDNDQYLDEVGSLVARCARAGLLRPRS